MAQSPPILRLLELSTTAAEPPTVSSTAHAVTNPRGDPQPLEDGFVKIVRLARFKPGRILDDIKASSGTPQSQWFVENSASVPILFAVDSETIAGAGLRKFQLQKVKEPQTGRDVVTETGCKYLDSLSAILGAKNANRKKHTPLVPPEPRRETFLFGKHSVVNEFEMRKKLEAAFEDLSLLKIKNSGEGERRPLIITWDMKF
ncbi:uncharacterized protein B0I36DRAFT_369304 [Microdochium trichocladiopsis]|uniref:Uncharacterized protein n=1 Tax=Microdochium trichocladiopsis TaxID=1682393 RepID=A0A9P8XSA8_9PEZI|nr:uncharacterized protein B0I36DRAFT_369304 [Microdochium trichocladiopsis]KAH7014336.1 hypothetical protein B0I36DRAFT_369304 [Microdochium trichocladiopsis]